MPKLILDNGQKIEVTLSQEELDKLCKKEDKLEFKTGKKYFYLSDTLEVCTFVFNSYVYIQEHVDLGNLFHTEEEAQKKADYMKAEVTLKRAIAKLNRLWIPNWKDKYENKWSFELDHFENRINTVRSGNYQNKPNWMYCFNKARAEEIIANYEAELMIR